MKLIIWCPLYILGGGSRLFIHLLNAIIRNPKISCIELIVPERLISEIEFAIENSIKIKIHALKSLTPDERNWFNRTGRILSIPGTGLLRKLLYRAINRSISSTEEKNELKQLLMQLDYDVLYCFWPHFQDYYDIEKPVVCTIQDTILFEFPELIGAHYTNLERSKQLQWISKSTQVVVSSRNTKKNIIKYFGNFQHIDVVRHDAVPDFENNATGFYDKDLPEKYIIYPANISPHKNHYNLLSSWSRFKDRKKFPLVFIGGKTDSFAFQGEEYPTDFDWHQLRLIGLIKRLGLKNNEDFFSLGYVKDEKVLGLIKNAYALIMPSLAEGGGSYPVEEALSVGTPVLCSDIPVMREHLNGRTAKIGWFDAESTESILSAMKDLTENYDDFKESTLIGMNDVRPTWDSIAFGYIKIFEKAIKKFYD